MRIPAPAHPAQSKIFPEWNQEAALYPLMRTNLKLVLKKSAVGAARGAVVCSFGSVFGGLSLGDFLPPEKGAGSLWLIPVAMAATTASLPVLAKSAAVGAAVGAVAGGGFEAWRQHRTHSALRRLVSSHAAQTIPSQ